MIEVKDLSKKYDKLLAVDNISFSITKSEIVGFLGPNGAGKTTTLKIVTCYIPPTSGSIKVAGFDIFENSLEVRKNIGYLPESNSLYYEMGVVEYLEFIANLRHIEKNKVKSRIKEVAEVCGLVDVIKKDIGELSKGYKQRVGIAQAIIHDPPILILDEPTSGLDPNQIVQIRELIKKLGREKTVVLSTHILSEVQATCDRAIIINKGKIVADGKTDELHGMIEGKDKVYIKLKGPEEKVVKLLKAVPNVEGVEVQDKEGPARGYQLQISKGVDMREELYNFSVTNKWPLLELKREVVSLEDVFRELTAGEQLWALALTI